MCRSTGGGEGAGVRDVDECRPEADEMTAFKTWAKVGLIPQAKQGGSGVYALAVVTSKFEGSGLESEQMEQIQVVFFCRPLAFTKVEV